MRWLGRLILKCYEWVVFRGSCFGWDVGKEAGVRFLKEARRILGVVGVLVVVLGVGGVCFVDAFAQSY